MNNSPYCSLTEHLYGVPGSHGLDDREGAAQAGADVRGLGERLPVGGAEQEAVRVAHAESGGLVRAELWEGREGWNT